MRFAALLVVLGACGRIAFDPEQHTGDDAPVGPDVTFRALCSFPRVTVIDNGEIADDAVGADLLAALPSACGSSPAVRTVSQDDAGILDAGGRPLLAADDLAIIPGGDGPSHAIRYLLARDTPLVWSGDPMFEVRERAGDRLISRVTLSSTHDLAIVMVVAEPIGGGRVLSAQGGSRNGTIAAGLWFTHDIAPAIASAVTQWAVIEWQDTDLTAGPDPGDTFTVIEMR